MAIIRSPTLIAPGSSAMPVSHSATVAQTGTDTLQHGGAPAVLNRPLLAAPSVDQLLNTSGGYAV